MAPLEPWEKVYIPLGNQTSFADIEPNHAIGCVACHNGSEPVVVDSVTIMNAEEAMALAHEGRIDDPSAEESNKCSLCHEATASSSEHSMHTKLWGERYKVAMRALGVETLEGHPAEAEFEGECGGCHTTCGQCHISRPKSVHGGFIDGHEFKRTPDMRNNCVACHGSRIGVDYYGENEGEGLSGNLKDIHLFKGKKCTYCHTSLEMHGDGIDPVQPPKSRYETPHLPQCTDCHSGDSDANLYHTTHWSGEGESASVSCFVCHSQQYYNCNSCHTNSEWKDGYGPVDGELNVNAGARDYREYPEFRMAVNPAHSDPTGDWSPALKAHSDDKWVLVRHVPVARDTYDPWMVGIDDLPNYDELETWQYTSPHNVRRWTDRTLVDGTWDDDPDADPLYDNASCALNCHYHVAGDLGNPANQDIYLHQDYLQDHYSDEVTANENMSVNFQCYSTCHAN